MNFYYSVHLPERLPGTSYRGASVPDPPDWWWNDYDDEEDEDDDEDEEWEVRT